MIEKFTIYFFNFLILTVAIAILLVGLFFLNRPTFKTVNCDGTAVEIQKWKYMCLKYGESE